MAGEATGAPDDRATALLGRGAFHVDQDDRSAAVQDLEAALAAFVDLGDPYGQAAAWTGLAVLKQARWCASSTHEPRGTGRYRYHRSVVAAGATAAAAVRDRRDPGRARPVGRGVLARAAP